MAWLDELKKITRPYDDDDDFDDFIENDGAEDYQEYEEPAAPAPEPAPAARSVFSKKERDPYREQYRAPAAPAERGKMKLVLKNPERFEEAADIADSLVEKRAVLMNLEACGAEESRRLIDFLSGVAYALGGKIKRVSGQAYILTPTNVDLVGDAVDDFESSGLYF